MVRFVGWPAGYTTEQFGKVGEEELEQAKEHLREDYALLVIREKFDSTVLSLPRLLGWIIYPFYVKREMSDDQRTKLSFGEEDIEVVRRHHRYDLLYRMTSDFARKLFESQRKQLGVSDDDVRRFVRWKRAYSEVAGPVVRITDALRRRI